MGTLEIGSCIGLAIVAVTFGLFVWGMLMLRRDSNIAGKKITCFYHLRKVLIKLEVDSAQTMRLPLTRNGIWP